MTTYLFERHLGHEMFCFNTLSFKTLPTPLLLHSYLFSCHEHCSDKFFCLEFWVLFGYVCIWRICRKSQSFASKTVSQENVLWSSRMLVGVLWLTRPTRLTSHTARLVDTIFTNNFFWSLEKWLLISLTTYQFFRFILIMTLPTVMLMTHDEIYE